jgi:small subunit ribosomal protein S25e
MGFTHCVKFDFKNSTSFIRGIFFWKNMGGTKKVSPAKQDKAQGAKETKKSRKDKGEGGPSKAEITVMVNEQQAMKYIQNAKVVTIHDLARQTGVKISAANAFLRNATQKGTVKRVGGYSGHYLYQIASS